MKFRPERFGNFTVALSERLRYPGSAHIEIAAGFTRLGNARERVRHRMPRYQQNALIPFGDLRNVALSHHRTHAVMRKSLDDHTYIVVIAVNAENTCPTHAIQWLEH